MILSQNIPLKKYSNFKIGGPASYFYEFRTKEDLINALREWRDMGGEVNNIFILGSGTNILWNDDPFEGLVLKDSSSFIKREKGLVIVDAGTLMPDLVGFCTQNSLSGLEWAGGLPGTVGGAIRGNAGAFLGEIGDSVWQVESLDKRSLEVLIRNRVECNFGYRQSVFKNEEVGRRLGEPLVRREVILSVKFKFKMGNAEEIKRSTQEKIDYRIDRHPLDLPNIGSTFKNVDLKKVSKKVAKEFEKSIKPDPFPVVPAAKLLVAVGLKGKIIGGAQFSEKHPNFIVNFNNAKSTDVKELIKLAKKEVKEKYNIDLEEEIMIV